MRVTAFFAMALLLAVSAPLEAAPSAAGSACAGRGAPHAPVPDVVTLEGGAGVDGAGSGAARDPSPEVAVVRAPWAASFAPVTVKNRNTNARAAVRLYDVRGELDRGEARVFMRACGRETETPDDASEDDERLDLRLVQLAVRASYHFGGAGIEVVSATRPGARGKHGTGEALDFALEGVKASVLAAYLRAAPRVGVGIYTHPKTQYVHLDVRDESYHWIDGSPPGVTWRERLLADPKKQARDASYDTALDLPEPPR